MAENVKPLLKTEDVSEVFGGLKAVADFNFYINRGELIGLIGPNGAGKTTIFNLITGVYIPTTGEILLDGESIVGLKPYEITQRGIARTFQNIRLFGNLTVADNVRIAMHNQRKVRPLDVLFRTPRFFRDELMMTLRVQTLLSLFNMKKKEHELAKNLPYGEQRKLEIARALAANPTLLLLDEPAAGMNPQETKELMESIAAIRREFKVTILLIEHDMKLVMGICERLFVLDYGRVIAQGTPQEVVANPQVIKAYLGAEAVNM